MPHSRIALALLALITVATGAGWRIGTDSGLELDALLVATIAGGTWLFFVVALRGNGTASDARPR